MTSLASDVIRRESLSVMVDAYKTACQEVDQAFELLNNAKMRLESAYGTGGATSFDCIYHMRYHTKPDDLKGQLKKGAWQALLNRLEIKKIMSLQDINRIYKSFDNAKDIPEIELSTLTEITIGLLENAPEYAKKLVQEAYVILMPGNRERNQYMTNRNNARRSLGKKIILTWLIEPGYQDQYTVRYGRAEDELMCIDKVFHTLDGKGIPTGYRSPLVDAINTTPLSIGRGETDYFKFWCYRNGNLHLEFKRMDLVKKLNQIASGNSSLAD